MERLSDLLGNYPSQPPDEVSALKRYIAEQFKARASVTAQTQTLVITVASASLANTLRLRATELQKIAGTSKRLVFRIGQ